MTNRLLRIRNRGLFALQLALVSGCATPQSLDGVHLADNAVQIDAGALPFIREMDERFQSFQVGMSHLTGGETWRKYDGEEATGEAAQAQSFDAIREARAPTDLSNPRLRNLTAALAPLYIRYGGTTSNSVYFHDADAPPPSTPPKGFQTILTRGRWKAAIDFAKAVDAKIITGFTVSDGVRDASSAWTPVHAQPWLEFTRAAGGEIFAAELYNEPNAREPGRTDRPESAENYARDFARLSAFRDTFAPGLKLAGPGTAMLGLPVPIPSLEGVTAEQYMTADPKPDFDIVSYHFYGALAERCAPPGSPAGVSADDALSEEWLARPDKEFGKFKALRDKYAPGAPIWLTETGSAACGGTRWQPTFLDTFHFLDRQGRLAKQGLDAIVTHALISGSNGVIDEKTFMPNADYWAALLWRRLMGTRILDAGLHRNGLHLYAHCQPGQSGGVTLMAINLSKTGKKLSVKGVTDLYSLTAVSLDSRIVKLNGKALALGPNDTVPETRPTGQTSGDIKIAPTSISFIVLSEAGNPACGK